VPDWSSPIKALTRWLICGCNASGISMAWATTKKSTAVLTAHVIECGYVDFVGAEASDDPAAMSAAIREWHRAVSDFKFYPTGEDIFSAFLRTICCNLLQDRYPRDYGLITGEEAKAALDSLLDGSQAKDRGQSDSGNDQVKALPPPFSRMTRTCLFATTTGHIGLASAATRPGDVVCTILGCPMPMVLRPKEADEYQAVGAAYVHGLMDAESVLGPLGEGWSVQCGALSGWTGVFRFHHAPTNTTTEDDPRLGTADPKWKKVEDAKRTPEDPFHFVRYRNVMTGEVINGHPNLFPDALRARGVKLKTFDLV
jgi:hypothetical protein